MLSRSLLAVLPFLFLARLAHGQSSLDRLIDSVATSWQSASTLSAEDLDHLVEQTVALRDVRMLHAARHVAISAGAPTSVRIAALRVLYSFATGKVESDLPDSIPSLDVFIGSTRTERESVDGPQPVDTASIASLATDLAPLSTDQNSNVRNLTALVLRAAMYYGESPAQLTYVCGNKFRVTNPNPYPLPIGYSVQGTSEAATLVLPARPQTGGYSQAFIVTKNTGSVQLNDGAGTVLQTAVNGGSPCRP